MTDKKYRLVQFFTALISISVLFCVASCSNEETPTPSASEQVSVSSNSESSSVAEKVEPFYVTSLLENKSVREQLEWEYPNITAWSSIYEYHSYEQDLRDGKIQEGSAWYNCVAVISTNQSGVFDRVVVSVVAEFSLTQTEEGRWTMILSDGTDPLNKPYIYTYKGREKDWKLGKCEDVEIVYNEGDCHCVFWFAEKGEALFFADPYREPIRAKGITEKPKVCRDYNEPYSQVAKIEDSYILRFDKEGGNRVDGETELALYRDEKITFFEEIEGVYPQQSVLSESLIAWGTSSRVCLYDISSENLGTPILILGGNGHGLADSEVHIIGQLFSDLAKPSRHCFMYYIKEEKQWRFCTVDSSGKVLCDFSTGLAVVNDTITSIKFENGLVYFSYYPNGATNPSVHYCVDVRPDKNHTPQCLD